MDQTGFGLPLRIDVASGGRLDPTGLDPYTLPWVQGAASTVHLSTRIAYRERIADLREKLSVLRSKRAKDSDIPTWGPRLRPPFFRFLDGRPEASEDDR